MRPTVRPFFAEILFLLFLHCGFPKESLAQRPLFFDGSFQTIRQRFNAPPGYKRIPASKNSFAAFLRSTPLLEDSTVVLDYKGDTFKEAGDTTVAAVLAIKIKGCRLEQCMDILMRLHSHWLLQRGAADSITYPLPDGTLLSWPDWKKGYRPHFRGTRFYLQKTGASSGNGFERFMRTLFEYSGTQTFYHYYKTVEMSDLQPGDFIVKKGRGHAVLVADIAVNDSGMKKAIFIQGDTPACQPYILRHPNGSVWFNVDTSLTAPDLPISKTMPWSGLRRFPQFP